MLCPTVRIAGTAGTDHLDKTDWSVLVNGVSAHAHMGWTVAICFIGYENGGQFGVFAINFFRPLILTFPRLLVLLAV